MCGVDAGNQSPIAGRHFAVSGRFELVGDDLLNI